MNDSITTLETLKKQLKKFVEERDWQQFHSPKNMSMLIAIEASELMEHFLWTDTQNSYKIFEQKREEIEHEIADVAKGILMFCQENNIDLVQAIEKKMQLDAAKYPIQKAKGSSKKYTEL